MQTGRRARRALNRAETRSVDWSMTIRGFLMASLLSLVAGGCSFTFAGGQGTQPAGAYGYGWSNGPGKPLIANNVEHGDGAGKPIDHDTPKATQPEPPQRDKPTKPPVRKPVPHRTKPGDTRPDPGDAPQPGLQPAPTGPSRPTREPKDAKPDKPAKPSLQPATPTGPTRRPTAKPPRKPADTTPDKPTRKPADTTPDKPSRKPADTTPDKPSRKPTLQPQTAVIHRASIR